MDKTSSDKVFEITVKDITKWGMIRFIFFWVCVVALYFQNHIFSLVLSVLMLSTIRIRKVEEKTFSMEYGAIPLLKRILYGKESN